MIVATVDVFSRTQIALTAAGTGAIVLVFAVWRLQVRAAATIAAFVVNVVTI